jgi:hypothetical protein
MNMDLALRYKFHRIWIVLVFLLKELIKNGLLYLYKAAILYYKYKIERIKKELSALGIITKRFYFKRR